MIVTYTLCDNLIDIPVLPLIVYKLLKKIPKGKVTTYGAISRALGDIIAARSIATILANNPYPDQYPCYKVVMSDGSIGGYSAPGGILTKISKLKEDGIEFIDEKIPLNKYLFIPDTFPYLASLKRLQEILSKKISLITTKREFRIGAGVDLAYLNKGGIDLGIGAIVAYDLKRNVYLGANLVMMPIFFPYIPTYLAFRELPVILFALKMLREKNNISPDFIVIDGHGILHPRSFGIASHVGIYLNIPTIGVAKKILVGKEIKEKMVYKDGYYISPVSHNGTIKGYLIKKSENKYIIVSPGNRISVDDALEIILGLPWTKGNTIDLVYIAHKMVSYLRNKVKNVV